MASPPPLGLIVLGAGAFGMIMLLSMVPTLLLAPVPAIPKVGRFTFEVGGYGTLFDDFRYQEQVCPCKGDWPIGTNERNVSNDIFAQATSIPDPRGLSSLVAFWGQFIDHDIVRSDTNASDTMYTLQMVPSNATLTTGRVKYRLLPNGCREPQTFNTPHIDASTVYGDSLMPEALVPLRNKTDGCKLNTSPGSLLPLNPAPGSHEFLAGDPRNSEHAILNSLHTLWVREHNRLCDVLKREVPFWTREEHFWKARQIVIAKMQHITYEHWLPALLGSLANMTQTVELRGTGSRIAREFSVTAYRFGHSMIPNPVGAFELPTMFFNRDMVIQYGIEAFLEASWTTVAQQVDNKVIDGLRNFLFSTQMGVMGEDLVLRNLLRAREVGIGTYENVSDCYGFPRSILDQEETYVGLLSEPLWPGSSLPLGIAQIVAEQFKRLREFDYYFHDKRPLEELGSRFWAEVQETTLASVIRQNALNPESLTVPDNVFHT